jgi:hypothetical protein
LKGDSQDKLTGLSGDGLALLCTDRGLAKGGSKADKVSRLLAWKKENKPKKDKGEKRARSEEAPPGQLEVHVTVGVKSAARKVRGGGVWCSRIYFRSQAGPAAAPASSSGLGGLTVAQLQEICSAHNLTKSGTKEVVVSRIKSALDQKSFTVEILKVVFFVCFLMSVETGPSNNTKRNDD